MFGVFQRDMYSVMRGNGVCLLLNVQAANMLNANGLFCVFPPLSRWPTVEACPRLTRCVRLCLCDRNRDVVHVAEQAAQGWIIGRRGSGGWVDDIRRLHIRALASGRHEPQLSGCNPPPCAAPAASSCHISDPEQRAAG